MPSPHSPLDPDVQRQVADELELYVYMLVDPRDGRPFYVGKGRRERFASHGWEAMTNDAREGADIDLDNDIGEKTARIREIRAAGLEPQIWILRHGMRSDAEYSAVEAACIDLLRAMPVTPRQENEIRVPDGCAAHLTNARRELSRGHGIMLLDDLVAEKTAPPLTYSQPLLTIALGGWTETPDGEDMPGGWTRYGYGYRSEWLTRDERVKHYQEIGESTCGWWEIDPWKIRSRGIEYMVAVHRGVTRALLRMVPGSWETQEYAQENRMRVNRRSACQFEVVDSGDAFDEIVGPYGHRVKAMQHAFYWPRNS